MGSSDSSVGGSGAATPHTTESGLLLLLSRGFKPRRLKQYVDHGGRNCK